jgi:hypothetical protein
LLNSLSLQDIINVLVKYCGVKFLSMSVAGSTLLISDFIQAAGAVISAVDVNSVSLII